MNDVAIKVNDISKLYKLYDKSSDRLKEALGFTKRKLYKEHYALHNVSFDIKKGETVGIIGTNGSGKSTILKIITGVLNPSGGTVEINGRISALLELGAGFNMEYTGIENIYLNGTMIGFSKEEIDLKMEEILKFADIGEFVYQPVKTYSSGMFVRLAFAVAINIEPEILIVDEALSVGDVFFQAKCYKKFEDFKKMGKTILFVSHDLGSISKYCDRVVLLNKGKKMAEGTPLEMVDLYKKVLVGQEEQQEERIEEFVEHHEQYTDEWKTNLELNPNVNEYGDKRATIIDFALLDANRNVTNTLLKGKEFEIVVKVRFEEDIENPIVAFSIKDLKGTEITGTNTMLEKAELSNFRKGDEIVVHFRQKLILQGGDYLLSLGCTTYEKDDFKVMHRLYDVCRISCVSDKNTVGYYDMDSQVTIEERG